MKLVKLLTSACLLLATLAAGGCALEPIGEGPDMTVRVVATRDFGHEVMFDELVEVPSGTSAMAALREVADTETSYGGAFVNVIDGVSSGYAGTKGTQQDWFICINGIQSNTGALDYTMHHGDVQRWDFHHWNFRMFIPAIVGDFPEPFLHGYGGRGEPTVVVYDGDQKQNAEELEATLIGLGVENVSSQPVSELSDHDKQNTNLIIVGNSDGEMITELNNVWNRLGFFVHFEDGELEVYTATGGEAVEYGPGTGIIQATQNPWNPKGTGACENVVWIVSGTDEAGIEDAVEALVNRSDELQHAFAVVVTDGEIIKVPQ